MLTEPSGPSAVANKPEPVANAMANSVADMANGNSTYRYRDAEKRRAYQREYMRKGRDAASGRA